MGLDVGIISIKYLGVPKERPYRLAWRLAEDGAPDAYMFGSGNSWIAFTQRQVLRILDDFADQHELTPEEMQEVRAWLESLPWIGGWHDPLPPDDGRDREYDYQPVRDNDDYGDGGNIELYFNW